MSAVSRRSVPVGVADARDNNSHARDRPFLICVPVASSRSGRSNPSREPAADGPRSRPAPLGNRRHCGRTTRRQALSSSSSRLALTPPTGPGTHLSSGPAAGHGQRLANPLAKAPDVAVGRQETRIEKRLGTAKETLSWKISRLVIFTNGGISNPPRGWSQTAREAMHCPPEASTVFWYVGELHAEQGEGASAQKLQLRLELLVGVSELVALGGDRRVSSLRLQRGWAHASVAPSSQARPKSARERASSAGPPSPPCSMRARCSQPLVSP